MCSKPVPCAVAALPALPPGASRGAAGRTRGFSLIEVLVSLAVCGLFLAVLLPAGTAAIERQRFSQLQVQAHSLAAQKIELLSVWPAALPSPSEGAEGPLQWSIQAIAIDTAVGDDSPAATLRHFRIKIDAAGQATPLLDLRIQRLSDVPGSGRAAAGAR
jgi:prepilin-type N-terminal cleavage/methylation domain-containing protein